MRTPYPAERQQAGLILVLLYLGYLLSFGDRVIFSLALKPIKTTLQLSDSQLGLLAGVAFAASYAIFSPLGGLIVDRTRRTAVMAGAIAFWSVATFATAFASSFLGMGFARAGVGMGEALLHPLAVSLVGDTVSPDKRPRAFSVYMSAGAVGGIVAQILGGLLVLYLLTRPPVELPVLGLIKPWQGLFIAAAVPGLVLAGAVLLLMREPRRSPAPPASIVGAHSGRAFLRARPGFAAALFAGISVTQMGAYTFTTWGILFFERVHGWSAGQAAVWMASVAGVATLAGCLLAGRMILWLRARGHADAPFLIAIAAAICFPLFASVALAMPSPWLTLAVLPLASFWGYVPSVAGFSAMGEVLPPPIRARLAGLHTLANGLITNSIGPYLVGLFSDHLFPGQHGLRWALIVTFLLAGVLGTLLLALGRRDYRALAAEGAK